MMRRDHNKKQLRQAPGPDTIIWEHMQAEEDEIDPRDFLAGFWRKKWIFALVMAVFAGAGIAYYKMHRPMYESYADIVVVSSNRSDLVAPENDIPLMTDLRALTRSRSLNTQTKIISSPEVIDEAYSSLGTEAVKRGFASEQAPEWSYRIDSMPDTDIIRITARAYTPAAAARFANSIANTYFNRDLLKNTQATRKARQTAEARMKIAETALTAANNALTDFKQLSGFISPDTQLGRMVERSAELSMSLDQAKAQAAADEQSVSSMQKQLAAQGQTVETSRNLMLNPRITAILTRIDTLNSERISILQEFTPESPEVARIDDSIRQEEARLKEMAENVVESKTLSRNPVRDTLITTYASSIAALAASSARERATQAESYELQQTLQQLPAQERQYLDLAQEASIAKSTFEMLANKYRTLLLSEQTIMPKGMLISAARMPSSPQYPEKKSVLMVFVLLGVMAGIAAALGADRLDQRTHNRQTIERILGLETLAMLPDIPRRSPKILSIDGQNPILLEKYRMLRNSINLSTSDESPRIIAVSSPSVGDGKSTVSINLAAAMALDGKRTLLVDADTRNPSLHKLLSTANDIGLIDVLRGELDLDEAAIPARIDNVSFLPVGKFAKDSPELLNSTNGREAFKKMRVKYDIVILDCPPSAGLGDMQIISTIADAVLLVVSIRSAIKPHLKTAAKFLEQAGANLIGLVINRTRSKAWEDNHISSYRMRSDISDTTESSENRTKIRVQS
ncbi:MAG: polysaccharide biosynthesis tyrosine autokinase [Armatimonadetes bacterium]|nr:polysaccharide biosynthesis tyrosine autokinase [Armatimonadota bacterium]